MLCIRPKHLLFPFCPADELRDEAENRGKKQKKPKHELGLHLLEKSGLLGTI